MGCNHNHSENNVSKRTIKLLGVVFLVNLALTFLEVVFGFYANSVSLIGDGLHNTSDAFSILISIIAYMFGQKNVDEDFTFGYKRAETIGSFINLVSLFISGIYLLFDGVIKIFRPEALDGNIIIIVSVISIIIDTITAKISHSHSHSYNMRMLFLHNLGDLLGSVGVIIAGIFAIFFKWYFVDGIIAIMIALYMVISSILNFKGIVRILMNAAPNDIDIKQIENDILNIKGVKSIHHVHLWKIDEVNSSFECHLVGSDLKIIRRVKEVLKEFDIEHSSIQLEEEENCNEMYCC